VVAPAAADPPTRTEFTVPLSGPHFLSAFCGTQIMQEGSAHIASTEYGDGRLIEHIPVDLALTAKGNIDYEEATFTVVVDPNARDREADGYSGQHPCPRRWALGARGGAGRAGPGDVRPSLAVGALDDPGGRSRAGLHILRSRDLTLEA